MKVSLLVPVYGVERYIACCAESLFKQTYGNLEFIFVDDCTPDASISVLEDVLARFPERRGQVRIIRHDHNKGLGAARATALADATGDCVMHVDSDDYMPQRAVETLCRRMEETGADVIDGGYERTFDGRALDTCKPYHGSDRLYMCLLLCQNVFSNRIWGRLYRRSLYRGCGVRHIEGIDYGEDYCAVIPLLLNARRAWVDDVVYCYRTDNQSSYTHVLSEKNSLSYLKANREVYDYVLEKGNSVKCCRSAIEYGMLNVIRHARKNGMDMELVYEITGYSPRGLMPCVCDFFLNSRLPYNVGNFVYKACRTVFIKAVSAF